MIYLPDILSQTLKGPIHRVIFNMVVLHLVIVFLMIPIRSIIFDTFIYRDIILFSIAILMLGVLSLNKKTRQIQNALDRTMIYYLSLGVIITLLFIFYSNESVVTSLREYRNHFFPFILFFITREIITDFSLRIKIANLFYILFIMLSLSTFFEYLLIKIINLSPYAIPWYEYTFQNSDRYIGNKVGSSLGYILPSQTPILGIFGWSHATAASLMCLFGFNYPFCHIMFIIFFMVINSSSVLRLYFRFCISNSHVVC